MDRRLMEKLHALIGPDEEILRIERNIDPTVQTKEGYYWLPVLDLEEEVLEGQKRGDTVLTIEKDRVLRVRTTVDKTLEDISQEQRDREEKLKGEVPELVLRWMLSQEKKNRPEVTRETLLSELLNVDVKSIKRV